jgi:hypothetical protein
MACSGTGFIHHEVFCRKELTINDVLKRVVEITTGSLLPYIATWNAIMKIGHTTQKFAVYLVTGC